MIAINRSKDCQTLKTTPTKEDQNIPQKAQNKSEKKKAIQVTPKKNGKKKNSRKTPETERTPIPFQA